MGIPTSTNVYGDGQVEGNAEDVDVDGKAETGDVGSKPQEGNTEVEVAVKDGR